MSEHTFLTKETSGVTAVLAGRLPTEDGWSGPGSTATTYQAKRIVEQLQVVPLSTGGLQIELHAGGIDLEIEVASTGAVKSIYWEKG